MEAPDSTLTAFYTSLYHFFLQPAVISDHGAPPRYSTFSQWDTFRAADLLRTLLTPDIEADIVNSMIDGARSRNYRNLFDPSTGFFRGRDSKGAWREPFEPYRYAHAGKQGGDFTEDLIKLLGGRDEFLSKLDSLFAFEAPAALTGESNDITGLIGQYSHGNEPCHHVIYLYTLAGRRDKAADLVRRVFRDFYRNEPGGLCGNDDCGQMSAWYIFSALGFYPVNPVGAGSSSWANPRCGRYSEKRYIYP